MYPNKVFGGMYPVPILGDLYKLSYNGNIIKKASAWFLPFFETEFYDAAMTQEEMMHDARDMHILFPDQRGRYFFIPFETGKHLYGIYRLAEIISLDLLMYDDLISVLDDNGIATDHPYAVYIISATERFNKEMEKKYSEIFLH